jgi:hypothetical protein
MKDNVIKPGEEMVGPAGPPVRNLSGEVETIGNTIRHTERGAGGRWKTKESRQVGGPLNKPSGPGGYDAVVGFRPEGWIPGVRNNAQRYDLERTRGHANPQYSVPDYSRGVDPERKSHDRVRSDQYFINHVAGCPACVVHGFVQRKEVG